MKPIVYVGVLLVLGGIEGVGCKGWTSGRKEALKDEVREMFTHAWEGYLEYAFPADELKPMSCGKNDNFGGYALTSIDSLDTILMMGNVSEFARMSEWVLTNLNFKKMNRKVSVFETVIRVLGGLLSAHLASERVGYITKHPTGFLNHAVHLTDRLMEAFDTPTGVPYNEINLNTGVNHVQGHTTCPAAAGTLLLEMGILTTLTGDCKYLEAAHRAMTGVWKFRSSHNLVGTILDIYSGKWVHTGADIGASHDSFFEYMLKSYIMFNDKMWLEMWKVAHHAAARHLQVGGNWYTKVNSETTAKTDGTINSLQAFWPGLLVLYGDIQGAILAFRPFECVFKSLGFIPEEFKIQSGALGGPGYPLRPEMVESAWLLHRATGDDRYLEFGEELLKRLNTTTRTKCGFAAVRDVRNKALEDKMDSYMLSETLKYLYLLFSYTPNSYVPMDYSHVLNTEAHPFPISYEVNEAYKKCKPTKACTPQDSSADCQGRFRYQRMSATFFDETYKRFKGYEEVKLREWEERDVCPLKMHYMRLAGLIQDDGRCFPYQYNVMGLKEKEMERAPASSQPKKAPFKTIQFLLDTRTFQLQIPATLDPTTHPFASGILIDGLSVSSFTPHPTAIITIPHANPSPPSLLCSYHLALDWTAHLAKTRGASYGEQFFKLHQTSPPSEIAHNACQYSISHVGAVVDEVEKHWRDLFRDVPPAEAVAALHSWVKGGAKQTLCTSAARMVLKGKGLDEGDIKAALIGLVLSVDGQEGGGGKVPVGIEWPRTDGLNEGRWVDTRGKKFECGNEVVGGMRIVANTATFGVKVGDGVVIEKGIVVLPHNADGCEEYVHQEDANRAAGKILLVERGRCTFHEKAAHAQKLNIAGLIVLNNKNGPPEMMSDYLNPSAPPINIPLVMVSKKDAPLLLKHARSSQASVAIKKSPHHVGPIDLYHNSILTADSPYGMVLWRATRPVPTFLQGGSYFASVISDYYMKTASGVRDDEFAEFTRHNGVLKEFSSAFDMSAEQARELLRNDRTLKSFSCLKSPPPGVVGSCRFSKEKEVEIVRDDNWVSYVVSEEDEDEGELVLPREGAAIWLGMGRGVREDEVVKGAEKTIGWTHSHGYGKGVGKVSGGGLVMIGWETLIQATEYMNTQNILPAHFTWHTLATVDRLYHQPIAKPGSVIVIHLLSLRDTTTATQLHEACDDLQAAVEHSPGYLARELLQTPSLTTDGHTYNAIDVTQWSTPDQAAASLLLFKQATSLHDLADRITSLEPYVMTYGKHNRELMPQYPLAGGCELTWKCD
eukprot:TRINITY_DN10517_c0_g1_i7.p1 TRINITY_DN10517_c0_g1~~TRINITY_DN10517_c0_g1_i7.p1  ORF type:complete len:1287 (+),score=215.01 TRINITY_DN10517_c0_g1_i7:41-3901(+)